MRSVSYIILLFLGLTGMLSAQPDSSFIIQTEQSLESLVDRILIGNGIRVGNIKVKGIKEAIAYFETDTTVLGFKKGIVMSTGRVSDVKGPNKRTGTSSVLKSKQDASLNGLTKQKTKDVMVIEFDFVPFHNRLSFQYVFGSEEYMEYVGSPFNDVFGFFVSGPGLKRKNIALLPDRKTVVSINNVNHKKNKKYYRNNSCYSQTEGSGKIGIKNGFIRRLFYFITFRHLSKYKKVNTKIIYINSECSEKEKAKLDSVLFNYFEFDGLTTNMEAWCYVKPYKKYHIKIAIGDVSDEVFDSGVFLAEKSFTSYRDSLDPAYKPYKDLSKSLNWDSVFTDPAKKVVPVKTIPKKKTENEVFNNFSVYFDISDTIIPDSSKVKLQSFAAFMNKYPHIKCIVSGYTDNTGSVEYNKELSKKRAASVTAYLVSSGVKKKNILLSSAFKTAPAGDEKGDAYWRRVDVKVLFQK